MLHYERGGGERVGVLHRCAGAGSLQGNGFRKGPPAPCALRRRCRHGPKSSDIPNRTPALNGVASRAQTWIISLHVWILRL